MLTLFSPIAFGVDGCAGLDTGKLCAQVAVHSNTEKAIQDIVVYIEPLDGQIVEQTSKEVMIDQVGKSFSPYISVSQINSKVIFANQDDITHHIYSAGSENKFSFKIKAGKTNAETQFTHASEVAMGCNIHDWMSGYLLVVNTPYFGKTDKEGKVNFAISEQGRYKIVLWHPQLQQEHNRMVDEQIINKSSALSYTLKNKLLKTPIQKSEDDFDFLSDYE